MTFTDTWTTMAWIKLTSYPTTNTTIIGRTTAGTNDGWELYLSANTGQLFSIFRGAGATYKGANSYHTIPLNKWVHVAVSHTASTNTATMYIDGIQVSASAFVSGGTPPTTVTQGGSLIVGVYGTGTGTFPGKLAQVAVFSSILSAATIQSYMSQTLAGTESTLISAYSFNNSINDLNTTNANNLTAQGSAVATNADSPFGGQANGNISSIYDYAIVHTASFSTNTTLVVQVSEGNTIPSSGGVTALHYSSAKAPYGLNDGEDKWTIETIANYDLISGASPSTVYTGLLLNIPIGKYQVSYQGTVSAQRAAAGALGISPGLSTSSSTFQTNDWTSFFYQTASSDTYYGFSKIAYLTLTSATIYYALLLPESLATYVSIGLRGNRGTARISARNAYL
jgi:hypothetical protein